MGKELNILLFSDHGMTKIQWMEKVIELDKYVNMSNIAKTMDRGPVVSLWPKEEKFGEVRLKSACLLNYNVLWWCLSLMILKLFIKRDF